LNRQFLRRKTLLQFNDPKHLLKLFQKFGSRERSTDMIDYYEFLQISPHADNETIHRVYRYLAVRLHPDNPESGDAEQFRLLKSAYDTLSSPSKRAEYDGMCRREVGETQPLSTSIDFLDSVEGELNRRIAVLAVLYFKRRANPRMPEVTLAEIELRMGFPRDYLDFTTWYLVKKGYVTKADNSDFTLTAEGVDYIESQRGNLPVLNKLLTDGAGHAAATKPKKAAAKESHRPDAVVLPSTVSIWLDRRQMSGDRRRRVTEQHQDSFERRAGMRDRRMHSGDRRQNKDDRRAYAIMNI
jgi:curved DNA-binding protein CbpA